MASFHEMDWKELSFNPFTKISKQWMLVTAGSEEKSNTMTASWGGVGFIWNKPVSFIFIRPQRYTKEFLDREAGYSLCFFDESHRAALNYGGSHSGRDGDKAKACQLTTAFCDGIPYYEEAELVLLCKKLYHQDMAAESFADPALLKQNYPGNDLHTAYIGEIVKVLGKNA